MTEKMDSRFHGNDGLRCHDNAVVVLGILMMRTD